MSNGRHPLPAADDLGGPGPQRQPGGWLRDLLMPLEHLLVSGGDSRLTLDPASRTNAYFCRPSPGRDTLEFSSSTASSISQRGYEAADRARGTLVQAAIGDGIEHAFDTRIEAMRRELRAVLGLRPEVEVIFSASGTDAQLQALYLGRAWLGPALTTLIVASDQTGSGTVFTARGQHFGERTANDDRVAKGMPLQGLTQPVDSVALPLRDAAGELHSEAELDAMVLDAVTRLTAAGGRVLLQAMDCSKLGWRAPTDQMLQQIASRWPDQVQIAIDACQMRLSRRRLADYLDRGYLVLITGSKFFTGPPFSGALLVPAALAGRAATAAADLTGLRAYNSPSDWPRNWRAARDQLPARVNLGQWLRWEVALEEMTAYYAVPADFRRVAIRVLGAGIARMIAASPHMTLLPLPSTPDCELDDELELPTIFGFTLRRGAATLPVGDCKAIHRALAQPDDDEAGQRTALETTPCLLGQPVEWRDAGGQSVAALRLCIGARHLSAAWSPDPAAARTQLDRLLDQVAVIIIRIEALLRQLDETATPEVSHGHCAH